MIFYIEQDSETRNVTTLFGGRVQDAWPYTLVMPVFQVTQKYGHDKCLYQTVKIKCAFKMIPYFSFFIMTLCNILPKMIYNNQAVAFRLKCLHQHCNGSWHVDR